MKKLLVFLIFSLFFVWEAFAKDLYLSENWDNNLNCETEQTACVDLITALEKAEAGDTIYLKTNVLVQNWGQVLELKWVTIDWGWNRLTFRWTELELLWDTTFKNLKLVMLRDWTAWAKIFLNWKNFIVEDLETRFSDNQNIVPEVYAWSRNDWLVSWNFTFDIRSWASEPLFEKIITSDNVWWKLDFTLKIWGWVKVSEVLSLWEASWIVENFSTKTVNFKNISDLKIKSLNWLSNFSFENIENLTLENDSNISLEKFLNIKNLNLWNDVQLSLKTDWNLVVENFSSWISSGLNMGNWNIFSALNVISSEVVNFAIRTENKHDENEKTFVTFPENKKDLVSWNIYLQNLSDNRIFKELKTLAWITYFWIEKKDSTNSIDKTKLSKLLDEYDALTNEQQALVDINIYNEAIDVESDYSVNQARIDEVIKKLELEIRKAKWEVIDPLETEKEEAIEKIKNLDSLTEEEKNYFIEKIKTADTGDKINEELKNAETKNSENKAKKEEIEKAKNDLKTLLTLAKNPTTISGKTDISVFELNKVIESSEKILTKENVTLDELKAEITKLDTAIKNLKNKESSSSSGGSGSWSSSSSSSLGSSSWWTPSSSETKISVESSDKQKETEIISENKKLEETTEVNKYQKLIDYFKGINKDFKVKTINSEERFYTISEQKNSCDIAKKVSWDFNKDYKVTFLDLTSENNLDEIQRLEKVWIVNWTKPGFFEPNRGITRAEFLAIVLKSNCYDISEKPESLPYSDVELNSWQAKVINVSHKIWLVKGYDDGTFRPNKEISKIEAFWIMLKISTIEKYLNFQDSFTDKKALWQADVLAVWEYLWILNPKETNFKFYPDSYLTRNEMVKIIVDILRLY